MLEYEWPDWLPDEVLFPVMRVAMPDASAAGYRAIAAQAPAAAVELARAGAGVVTFACTIGSLFEGQVGEGALRRAIRKAAGLPTLTLAATSIEALRRIGARRIATLSPYSDEQNGWIGRYLEESGLEVGRFIQTPASIASIGNFPADEIAAYAIDAFADMRDCDALWIPCTAIRTLDAIEAIESASGRPVISGSQALLWAALAELGLAGDARPCGRLFRTQPDQTT